MSSAVRDPLVPPDARELLRVLRTGPARTRAQLAQLTGLARSTVSARLDGLISTGLVAPAGDGSSTGGRPPALLAFRPSARIVLAVDLGATHGVVAMTDLAGNVLHAESREISIAAGPEPVLGWALAAAERVLDAGGRARAELIGVGVGLPGPVEHATGLPTNPPIMPGWNRFDVPAFVQQVFDVPVLVDNDVNLLALGERALFWPGERDLVFVKVSTGVGAGIISGGRLQRGAQGSAGDLGHVRVPVTDGTLAHGDADADLEARASGPAIARWMTEHGSAATSSRDVLNAGLNGEAVAIRGIRQAGRDLGEVLATVVNLLNPSVVVIGGSISRAGEHLLAGVREVVYGRSTPLATQHLSIVHARAGATGGVLGAAIMVIQRVLDQVEE